MSGTLANLLRHVQQLVENQRIGSLSDRQLLERFAGQRDEAAFALLVRRHGPMVLGVCRRLLGHEQDAEDAFQAVFLILARRAGAIRQADVGGFLYRVAYRLAVRACSQAAKRLHREQRAETPTAADPVEEVTWREVRQVVDEELQRLPGAPRSALVLCYLEGKTLEEAARSLGCSKSTLRRRLDRGRELLRRRLLKRGLAPMAALTASLFAEETAVAVPAALADAVVRAAVSGTACPAVAALVKVGSALVSTGKAKAATMILLATSLLGGAGIWFAECPMDKELVERRGVSPPVEASTGGLTPRRSPETMEIQGRVLDPDGNPKSGGKLLLLDRTGQVKQLGVTAADGRFRVAVAKETTKKSGHWLVAKAEGAALDFQELYEWKAEKPVELRLVKDNAIRGRVVSTEGKPVRGVRVTAVDIAVYRSNSLETFRAAWMKFWAGGAGTGIEKQLRLDDVALFTAATDADGRFTLRGLGIERTIRLRLSGGGIADTLVWVANRAGFDAKPFNQAILDHYSGTGRKPLTWQYWLLSGPDVAIVAEAEKVIRGVVADADTGKGQAGVVVWLSQDSDDFIHYPPKAKTDAQGRYEIHGVRKTKGYLLSIYADPVNGYMFSQVWADDTVAHQPVRADIKIKKGVIVTGHIIDGATGKAITGDVMAAILRDNPFAKDYPMFSERGLMGPFESFDNTDDDHVFRVVTIPGPILLMGKPQGISRIQYKGTGTDPKYPQYFDSENGIFHGYKGGGALQGIWNKVLQIEPGVAVVKKDIVLEREKAVAEVRIQDAEGRPLAGAWAAAIGPKNWIPYGRLEDDAASVYGDAIRQPQLLIFYHPEKKLAGILTLKGDEKQSVVVKLGPHAAIEGRLLGTDGKPLAEVAVDLRYRDRAAANIHEEIYRARQILTDTNGAFAVDEVLPGLKFELSLRRGKHRFERETKPADPTVQIKPGERRDLGTIKLTQIVKKSGE